MTCSRLRVACTLLFTQCLAALGPACASYALLFHLFLSSLLPPLSSRTLSRSLFSLLRAPCRTAKAGHRISKGDPARQTVLSEWRFVSTNVVDQLRADDKTFLHAPTYLHSYLPTYLSNLTIYLPTYPPISPRQPIDGFFFVQQGR